MKLVSHEQVDFAKEGGLVPVAVKDMVSGKVLMLAYANREALQRTLQTGFAHYYSRHREKLWKKGEGSGHVQRVQDILVDCDRDALVYVVDQLGPACHTGEETCFFSSLEDSKVAEYDRIMLGEVIELFESAHVVKRPWVKDSSRRYYEYFVNPVNEGIPPAKPEVLEWIAAMVDRISSPKAEKIVTFEALGIPYAMMLAQRRKRTLVTIRKRNFYAPQHIFTRVPYASGFERGTYYIYNLSKGDRVLIMDDMVSTGGSLIPTLQSLSRRGVRVEDVVCVVEKPEYGGTQVVEEETGFAVRTLFQLHLTKGRVKAEPSPYLLQALRGGTFSTGSCSEPEERWTSD